MLPVNFNRRPWLAVLLPFLFAVSALFAGSDAHAVPSFARQTGLPCNKCHVNSFGPALLPYGREFKLNGYVWGSNKSNLPALSGMVMGSLTHTQKGQDAPGPGYNANNNLVLDQASLFYGGRIWGKLGAFSQLTYDGLAERIALDNTDVRLANEFEIGDWTVVSGISANNSPTVQDLWNTTPAWGFPYIASPYAASPSAAALIDGGLGTGQVGGMTLYTMINGLAYIEAGAYSTFSRKFQQGTGTWDPGQNTIDGGAPYWRVALQHDFDGHYVSIGHYGLRANVFPGGCRYASAGCSFGTDRYTDLAFDATYQYVGNLDHIVEMKSTYIRENQELFATHASGGSAFSNNQLNTFKINAGYTYQQTYSLTFGYNRISGTTNTGLYNTAAGFALSGKPDSQFYTVELDYVPFGKADSLLNPWLNLRVALQYVAYSQFNGTQKHAEDNNTLLLNGWLAF